MTAAWLVSTKPLTIVQPIPRDQARPADRAALRLSPHAHTPRNNPNRPIVPINTYHVMDHKVIRRRGSVRWGFSASEDVPAMSAKGSRPESRQGLPRLGGTDSGLYKGGLPRSKGLQPTHLFLIAQGNHYHISTPHFTLTGDPSPSSLICFLDDQRPSAQANL